MSWQDEAEDVWAIVQERDGLRIQVKRLEAENRRLRTIIASIGEKTRLKPMDRGTPTKHHAHSQQVPR